MTCGILLWATVGIHAYAVAENSALIVQGGVGFAAIAGRILWHANAVTPEPALIMGAIFRVAGHVSSSISLYLVFVRTAAVEDTVITGCWLRVIIVRTGSMTELCFADSLASGAHWILSASISVNPTVGAAILWWKAAVLETVPGECDCSTLTGPLLPNTEAPAFVSSFITCPIAGLVFVDAAVATPIPAIFIRTVLRVAGHVASSVGLYLVVVRTAAVEDTVITGYRCWVIIVGTGSMTELCFADSLSSGAHWILGVSISVNPTVGAAILW